MKTLKHGYIFLWCYNEKQFWYEINDADSARRQLYELGFGCKTRVLTPDGFLLDAYDAYNAFETGQLGDFGFIS